MTHRIFWTLLLICSAAACTTPDGQSSIPGSPLQSQEIKIPDTVTGQQMTWYLSVHNGRQGKTSADEIRAHFHQSFLSKLPVEQTMGIFQQLAAELGTLTPQSFESIDPGEPGVQTLIAHAIAKAGRFKIILSIDVASGLINGLYVQPDAPAPPIPTSYEEADKMLQALAPKSQLLVAEVNQSVCTPIHQLHPTESLAIGSAFKLYVLLGLANQVQAKKLSWDTQLAIREDWKSLPSGTMQSEPAGKQFPVRYFAEKMISISDNTATDHLLYKVGREQVETTLTQTQHHRPALNRPFLSTRELFILKMRSKDREAYLQKNETDRRNYLTHGLSQHLPTEVESKTWGETPQFIDSLEWFATGDDICKLLIALRDQGQKEPQGNSILDILAKNPDLPESASSFVYMGFKGGSEPGVLSLNWLIQKKNNRWYVVSLAVNNPKQTLDENALIGVATGILRLLAAKP